MVRDILTVIFFILILTVLQSCASQQKATYVEKKHPTIELKNPGYCLK